MDMDKSPGPRKPTSTPSRDMRLLISLDTVVGFPDLVRRHPERFGADADSGPALADEVEAALRALGVASGVGVGEFKQVGGDRTGECLGAP